MTATSSSVAPSAFFVHVVTAGAVSGTFLLDGRCVEGNVKPGDRFVGLYLVDFDEDTGTSSSELLAEVDLRVLEVFSYGKLRKQLDRAMTGRLTVRQEGGEAPISDALLRTASDPST